jgi:hypothetical protein
MLLLDRFPKVPSLCFPVVIDCPRVHGRSSPGDIGTPGDDPMEGAVRGFEEVERNIHCLQSACID